MKRFQLFIHQHLSSSVPRHTCAFFSHFWDYSFFLPPNLLEKLFLINITQRGALKGTPHEEGRKRGCIFELLLMKSGSPALQICLSLLLSACILYYERFFQRREQSVMLLYSFQITCQCLPGWEVNHLGQLHNKQGKIKTNLWLFNLDTLYFLRGQRYILV